MDINTFYKLGLTLQKITTILSSDEESELFLIDTDVAIIQTQNLESALKNKYIHYDENKYKLNFNSIEKNKTFENIKSLLEVFSIKNSNFSHEIIKINKDLKRLETIIDSTLVIFETTNYDLLQAITGYLIVIKFEDSYIICSFFMSD